MDFALQNEQRELQELALRIIADHATHERLKRIEASQEWIDRKLWEELARADLLGVALPEAHGGSGLGFLELCLLAEAVGRHCAPVPVWPTLVLGALPVARFGDEDQQAALLPRVAAGATFLSAALLDHDNDDPTRTTTRAQRDGAGWRLRGIKICVPMAHLAERIVVPAHTGPDAVGLFLVDPAQAEVVCERHATTMGEPQFRIVLNDVHVPDGAALGDPSGGTESARWLWEHALAALCAIEIGVVERALRMTAEYTSNREQFGKPIAKFQAVAQRAADAYIDVEAIRWTTWQAIWRLSCDQDARDELRIAKFWVGEGGHRVVYAAQHLHGGIGVDLDYPLYRSYLWSKQIELTLGPATKHLAALGVEMAEER